MREKSFRYLIGTLLRRRMFWTSALLLSIILGIRFATFISTPARLCVRFLLPSANTPVELAMIELERARLPERSDVFAQKSRAADTSSGLDDVS